ncbi:GSCOCT00014271001.2-RA-CDS [Cotesia congregata]|uniref:Cc_crp.2_18.5 n=1 Tax=Cotesia congregata TaxID=51543 RepID=S6D4U5_COTCN|nr:GSCOCT00014271001.2-RA-CDS [Cotesia congregata]CAG5092555.1 cc_crp.2_18.5 [Cotesia congregata]CCQ71275.1 hypothetical protein CRP2 [Cotesia congregata]
MKTTEFVFDGVLEDFCNPQCSSDPNRISYCRGCRTTCLNSKLPCCKLTYQNSYLRLGEVPTTCFKFGKGICQVNQSIKNFNEYSKLIEQVN